MVSALTSAAVLGGRLRERGRKEAREERKLGLEERRVGATERTVGVAEERLAADRSQSAEDALTTANKSVIENYSKMIEDTVSGISDGSLPANLLQDPNSGINQSLTQFQPRVVDAIMQTQKVSRPEAEAMVNALAQSAAQRKRPEPQIAVPETVKLQNARAELEGQLATTSPEQQPAIQRQIDEITAKLTEEKPADPTVIRLQQTRDGLEDQLAKETDPAIRARLERNIGELDTRIAATQAFDPRTAFQLTGKEIVAARESLGRASESMTNAEKLLTRTKKQPGAIGLRGALIDEVAGPVLNTLRLFGQESAASLVSESLDVKEVQEIRKAGQRLGTEMITVITGDNSGRYTDKEQQLARDFVGIKDPKAPIESVVAGIETLIGIMEGGMDFDVRKIIVAAKITDDALAAEDGSGVNELHRLLIQSGVSDEKALDAIIRHLESRGL